MLHRTNHAAFASVSSQAPYIVLEITGRCPDHMCMKRIFLFLMTNLAVLALLTVVVMVLESVFHVRLGQGGLGGLLVMAAVFGFGGAFISLLLSKWIAKRTMGVVVIVQPRSELEQWLIATVQRLSQKAGVSMPEVGIFDSPEMNAFATGARRNAALVAVSSGLLRGMSRNQIEAVLGHEMTHVSNGDMVTLTLIQGVVNTFVIFLSRIIGSLVDRTVFKSDRDACVGRLCQHDRRRILKTPGIPRRSRRCESRRHWQYDQRLTGAAARTGRADAA